MLNRDLHTVDDGVLRHLSSELASDDWEFLVAHFLGVDHVGHTFGPASQAMADKLDQMDDALRCRSYTLSLLDRGGRFSRLIESQSAPRSVVVIFFN